jgi:2-phosphoglycerate kinase
VSASEDLAVVQPWRVLVVLGASGTGKSTASAAIGRRLGMSWLQVDDLRLALQYSRATLPEHNEALYYFLDNPDFALEPPDEVSKAFIGTAQAMIPAVRIVIDSHVATESPMVIEGDGIHPALAIDPVLRPLVERGVIRFCCVEAVTHRELLENMVRRGRGGGFENLGRASRHADANWAFNAWLVGVSHALGISVVPSQPFETLAERIEASVLPTSQSKPA